MFKKILVPIDIDDANSWQSSIPIAVEFSRSHGADLHVMSVVPTFGMSIVGGFFSVEQEHEMIRKCRERLVEIVSSATPDDITAKAHIAHGKIYEEILLAADKLGINLILMVAHRPELNGYFIGSNAERVVRHARLPVLILRN